MKSIKEKAEERYPIITGELQTYNEKFVEGANYVLDKMENSLQEFSNYEDSLIISRIIEQLKK